MKKVRRFLIRILEDSEDDIPSEVVESIPLPDQNAPASLEKIQNNELWHLTYGHNQLANAVNGLLLRVGRTEAKVGLILALAFGIFGLAAKPILESAVNWFMGMAF